LKNFFARLFGQALPPFASAKALPGASPCAAQCAAEAGLETAGWIWYFAQPIHLEARMEHLVPSADLSASLDANEWQQLEAVLNAYFDDETWRFFLNESPVPRLFLRVTTPFAFSPLPISEIIGRPIASHWPSTTEARPLARPLAQRLNEIQMLLHETPFNAEREASGKPPVNGLWLWDSPSRRLNIKP